MERKACPACKTACPEDVCANCGSAIPGTSRVLFAEPTAQTAITNQPKYNYSPVKNEFHSTESMAVRVGDRLIFDFEKWPYGCFETGTGIDPQVKHDIPIELSSKGVLADQWYDWMTELARLQKLAPSELGTCIMFCIPGIFIQALLCTLFCPISMNHPLSDLPCCHGDWYEELKKWMENVNGVLNENGMHAKFQTYKPPSAAPKSKAYHMRMESRGYRYGYEMSFLVIALTPEESRKLQEESWDNGVNDCLLSGIGRCV